MQLVPELKSPTRRSRILFIVGEAFSFLFASNIRYCPTSLKPLTRHADLCDTTESGPVLVLLTHPFHLMFATGGQEPCGLYARVGFIALYIDSRRSLEAGRCVCCGDQNAMI